MPFVSWLQSNFNGGELSPSLIGRVQEPRYKESLATCLNYLPVLQGWLDRRPGTYFVKEVKDSSKFTRIRRFKFSNTQAYILEFGDKYVRIYTNHGQLLDGGNNPVEVVTPYATADLTQLNFEQSADVLYITCGAYPPAKLMRLGATTWQYRVIKFQDGPFLLTGQVQVSPGSGAVITKNVGLAAGSTDGTGLTLAVSFLASSTLAIGGCDLAADGVSVRVSISGGAQHAMVEGQQIIVSGVIGTTEANGTWFVGVESPTKFYLRGSIFANAYSSAGTIHPSVFTSQSVGQQVRHFISSKWGWGTITAVTNAYTATIDIDADNAFGSTGNSAEWRLGVWCPLLGYPACVRFHEDRLGFSGTPQFPQRVDLSNTSDYENFSTTDVDGTVVNKNALSFTLNSHDENVMRWLVSDEKGLLGGSIANEWIVRPSINQDAMTPTNISAKRTMGWGSAPIEAVSIGKATLFLQRGAKKIREMLFYFDIDGYRALDLTELSEHITGAGITAMAHQLVPYNTLWLTRSDGVLVSLTYEREMQVLKVGWARHIMGGQNANVGPDDIPQPPLVESIDVIPSPDGTRDELWMVVRRYVNGATKRYIEYMGKFFEDTDNQQDAHFVDCGVIYDNPITVTGFSPEGVNAILVSAPAHGFSNGDQVIFRDVVGSLEFNGNRYTVASAATDTFRLNDSSGNPVNFLFTPYISGGTVRKLVTTITGLTWLENEIVDVLADGAVVRGLEISGAGALILPNPTATAHIGYGYNSDAQLLPAEAGSADGTALGKQRRTTRASIMLHRSLGLKFGMNSDNLDTLPFRTDEIPNNQAPPLFTGIVQENIEADYDWYNQLFMRQDEPLPSRILAVALDLETQDRR